MLGRLFDGIKALFNRVDTLTLFKWASLIFRILKARKDNTFNIDADDIIQLLSRNTVMNHAAVSENEVRILESLGGTFGHMGSQHLIDAGQEIIAILKERDDNTFFHDADKANALIEKNTITLG